MRGNAEVARTASASIRNRETALSRLARFPLWINCVRDAALLLKGRLPSVAAFLLAPRSRVCEF